MRNAIEGNHLKLKSLFFMVIISCFEEKERMVCFHLYINEKSNCNYSLFKAKSSLVSENVHVNCTNNLQCIKKSPQFFGE